LGIANSLDPDNTNNQVILILKYHLYKWYKCRCLGDKPSINGGIKYLKYCIKIEKTTINFLYSTQKEYTCKKWLSFENLLGVWHFSVVLQNVCFDKLNVLCLNKIVYTCHMFLYLYLALLFFKNKQIKKKQQLVI
jgi:hypothetical protein